MAVSLEVASAEVSKWLDSKKISQAKRENKLAGNIEILTNAIADGSLVMNPDDFTFEQTLKFPLQADGQPEVPKLKFKNRLKVGSIQNGMAGNRPGDMIANVNTVIAALVSLPKELVKLLDTEDYEVASNIAFFFMI
ncbi:MAG TPA: phage tail assembly protein [Cyclobacteriaceae bacterium]|jgi:hypothetical protein|nr:phage tail assembly protein [Cyclobacteriaceae bacterium]